jgi:phage terminase large subunit-like protein
VSGRQLAGRAVRQACARHLEDIREAKVKGLEWRPEMAARVIAFFAELLTLTSGSPFVLLPYQAFIVGSVFGWYGADGFRRFRTAFVETGKGSGKTPLAAGVGLYGLVADGEPTPEVYAAATAKDQAKIAWSDAERMVEASPELREVVDPRVGSLNIEDGGVFRPVSSEHRNLDGLRVHVGVSDELHEHRDSLVVDKIRAGTKTRRNALLFNITNAGQGRHSVCWTHHEMSLKVLEGAVPGESWFAYVCQLDPCERCRVSEKRAKDCPDCDSWLDEKVWPKVNPALGHFLPVQYLRDLVQEAKGMPTKESITRRLNFCEWIEGGGDKAIALELWDKGSAPLDLAALRGRECFGGLDLARVNDLSALELIFPPKAAGEKWKVLSWFWVPEDDVAVRSKRDHVPYDVWVRQGFIEATPGNTTDYGFIEARIVEQAGLYKIKEIAFDRTFAGEIIQGLRSEGLTMVEFGQGFLSMAAPTAELLRLVKGGQLQHGGNPVLRWMASNLSVATDAAGNMKPDKERSSERIDGISAVCNALGRACNQPKAPLTGMNARAARGEPVFRTL